ncbi:hypothetical protein [Herbaspirillum sp. 1130]|uniref:hypothetical protein n=1 Tax=Herbaspirillum sp. 1130 TaxID=2806562 RepID=UPI001AE8DD32|nr:hypothetical protein [Herbaspirillum sp. 1130]MBP1316444.1 hypothetical protein [Herbaspirillum sp. 1130]
MSARLHGDLLDFESILARHIKKMDEEIGDFSANLYDWSDALLDDKAVSLICCEDKRCAACGRNVLLLFMGQTLHHSHTNLGEQIAIIPILTK